MAGARKPSSQGEMLQLCWLGRRSVHQAASPRCTGMEVWSAVHGPSTQRPRRLKSGQKSCLEQLVSTLPRGRPQHIAVYLCRPVAHVPWQEVM